MLQRTIPRRISFLLSFLLPVFSLNAQQGCDCQDAGNCLFNFGPEATEVCYEVSGLSQNELGNGQSICGVNVHFRHGLVYNLELSLVSPDGTEVQLVGESYQLGINDQFGTTFGTEWNVLFVPNNQAVYPDTIGGVNFDGIWTNPQYWPSVGQFNGSYYPNDVLANGIGTVPDPSSGLETFDSGPANGEWCLKIDNSASLFSGQIINFEVIFCDIGGLPCCIADAGELDYDSNIVNGCQGDSSLILELDLLFPDGQPDSNYYDYAFLLSDDQGLIQHYDSIPNLMSLSPGDYTVCGLSYLLADSSYLDSLVGIWNINLLEDTLDSDNPLFCADLTDDCVSYTVDVPPIKFDTDTIICEGDFLEIQGQLITTAGSYTFVYENPLGCDTLAFLDLSVETADTTNMASEICSGDTLDFYSQELTISGTYEELLQNFYGCDSLIRLELNVLPENLTLLSDTICIGNEFAVGDSLYTSSGFYSDTLIAINGCDSIVNLDLYVEDLDALISGPLVLSCSAQSLSLDASLSTGSSGLSYQWFTIGGQIDTDATLSSIDLSEAGSYILEVYTDYCSDRDTVIVIDDIELPVIDLATFGDLTCAVNQVDLDASGSTFTNSGSYFWSTVDGNIVSGETTSILLVDMDGTYVLSLTDSVNGCFVEESFEVLIDTLAPIASAGDDLDLNCAVDELDLDGTASDYLGPYSIFWTDIDGNLIPGTEGDLEPEVNMDGSYVISVENTVNNCVSLDTVVVLWDTLQPTVDLGLDLIINCINPEVVINGSVSAAGSDSLIVWDAPIGGILSGANSLSPIIQEAGTYIVSYTNLDNLCSDQDTVLVSSDFDFVDINAGFDFELDCQDTSFVLGTSVQNPTGPGFVYSWYNSSGQQVASQQEFTVDTADTYIMELLNQDNGCISLDTVEISSNQRVITASTNTPDIITCALTNVDLEGSYTDVLATDLFLIYSWIDPDGNVISNNPNTSVSQHGDYLFTVFDGFNGCTDTVGVEVIRDVILPDPNAGLDLALDCETGLAVLTGSFPDDPNIHVSNWYTNDGNILASTDLEITVDEDGVYFFEVTNTVNSCSYQDAVNVYLDSIACTPQIVDVPDVLLSCYTFPNDTIDATNAFVQGPHIEYNWQIIEGIFASGDNTLTPDAVLGIYVLEVTNTVFDLVSRDTVYVLDNRVYPEAVIQGGNFTADCADFANTIELSGAGSTTGPEIIYNWDLVIPDGNVLSGQDAINCFIDGPGLYDFTVTDTLNGCSSVRSIFVDLEGSYPEICLDDFAQFDCDSTSIVITDDCILPDYTFDWSIDPSFGQLEGANGLDSVPVSITSSPSTLYLEVTDTTNQCTTLDSIQIFGEGQCFPDCNIEIPEVLTCSNTSITLDGSTTSMGSFSYSWSTTGIGEFCGNTTSASVCVSADGFYTLLVTDNDSGLSCSSTIEVFENLSVPLGNVQPVDSLNCSADSVSIHFDVFGAQDFSVAWITADGNCEPSEFTETIYFASCGGEYGLVLTSGETGCNDTIEFEIPMDTIAPVVFLSAIDTLDCLNPSLSLYSSGSVQGDNYIYTYFDPNGNVISTGQDLEFATAYTSGEYCLNIEDISNGCVAVDCFDVVDDAYIFNTSVGDYDPLDCDSPNLVISGSSDAFDNLVYYWESVDGCFADDANQQAVLIDCPGTYTFVAYDTITYCLDSVSVLIDQDSSLPLADAGPDIEIDCSDNFVLFDASNSETGSEISYYWYTNDGNILANGNSINPLVDMVGTYYLVVENVLTDCQDTSVVEVVSGEDFPVADAGDDGVLGCENESFQVVDNMPSTGDSIYYSWEAINGGSILSGSNSANPVFDQEGLFVMEVIDSLNGCISLDTMVLIKDETDPIAEINAQSNYFNCFYEEISMSALNSTPFGGLDYFWDTVDGLIEGDNEQANITALQEGTYSLIVTNTINNCRDTISVELDSIYSKPNLEYELPEELNCKNEFVVLDASASSSLNGVLPNWSGPSNANIVNAASLSPSVDTAGLYTLIIKDALSLCSDSIDFVVYEDYSLPTAILSSTPVILCEVNDAVLDLSSSEPFAQVDFEWVYGGVLFNNEDSIVEVNQEGDYLAIAVDVNNGCRDSLDINVFSEGVPIDSVEFLVADPSCYGFETGEVQIGTVSGGSAPFMYAIDDSDLASHIYYKYLSPGEYTFVVEDADGCVFEQIIEIVEPDPIFVDLGEDLYIRYGEIVELSADIDTDLQLLSVNWDKPLDDTCPTCLKASASPEYTTDYTVYVRNTDNCLGEDQLTVFVDESPGLYIPNTFSPNGDNTNGIFMPFGDASVEQIEEMQIYDRWGGLVFKNNNFAPNDSSQGWDGRQNGELLQAGVFTWLMIVRLANGELIQMEGSVTLMR